MSLTRKNLDVRSSGGADINKGGPWERYTVSTGGRKKTGHPRRQGLPKGDHLRKQLGKRPILRKNSGKKKRRDGKSAREGGVGSRRSKREEDTFRRQWKTETTFTWKQRNRGTRGRKSGVIGKVPGEKSLVEKR